MLQKIIGQRSKDPSSSESSSNGEYAEAPAGNSSPYLEPASSPAPIPASSPTLSSSKNILSSDVEIKGSLKFSHDLIVDGKIDGEVESDGALTIGENATILGDVRTRSVVIFGKVLGNVIVQDRCELKANAVLEGDITAGTLSIEEGATFMGKSQVGTASRSAGLAQTPAE